LYPAEDASALATSLSLKKSRKSGLISRPESVQLGSIASVGERTSRCPFCKLVWNAFQDQTVFDHQSNIDKSITVDASWELDGRELIYNGKSFSSRPRTRRIRLAWSNQSLQHAYVVLVARDNLPRDSVFLGRSIEIADRNIDLVRGWIRQCDEYHDHRCEVAPQTKSSFSDVVANKRFRLLDVEQMRVTSMIGSVDYVALSYVGGSQHPFFLTTQSIELLQHSGLAGIMHTVPQTIQDAVRLVKDIGMRYLWAYAFSVLLDNREDTLWNHSVMDQIFGNAYLTICAADNPGADAGLRALNSHRVISQHMEICGPDLQLMVSYPAETYIKQSIWSRRAWTLQERLLSRRCLVFAGERVWFQCHGASMSEDIITSKDPGWSIDMLRNPAQLLGDVSNREDAIQAYMRCVELYTPREITHIGDFLLGFEGLCKLLGHTLGTGFISGLPSALFDLAILWEPETGRSRRREGLSTHFPSWSWSGWVGKIIYRPSTISGILDNVQNWLTEHTWISWYTRDRFNNLRLLCEESVGVDVPTKLESSIIAEQKLELLHNSQPYPQPSRSIKWPGQNRSVFYKKMPDSNLAIMDLDHIIPEDPTFRTIEFLQFWTWSAFFYISPVMIKASNLNKGLSRFNILDYKEDICGTIILPDDWELRVEHGGLKRTYEFVAISEARDFTAEEYDGWTYYIPKEREESKWDLWYALMVEYVDGVVVNRIGLGKVFKEAFENSCEPGIEWREFIMA